jgi:MFS transporter, putative metabolite:H+ symporter
MVPPVRKAVLVAALGYFVDMYDLVLFGVLRLPSLKGIGLEGPALTEAGVLLLNTQVAGIVLGSMLWGALADKRGRLTVLFGSILTYSLANLANALVTSVPQYAALRFVAGVGLAGELGAGVTLVSESLAPKERGFGTTFVAALGLAGALTAGLVGAELPWRASYVLGGVMGLALLFMRAQLLEPELFRVQTQAAHARGSLRQLFDRKRLGRFVPLVLVAIPNWYLAGILMTFSPEVGKALGMANPPTPAQSTTWMYVGVVIGDVIFGLLSQALKSRKRALYLAHIGMTVGFVGIFAHGKGSPESYLGWLLWLGLFSGFWAVFVTTAAELFGTNLRGTAATTAPCFVRGFAIPVTLSWRAMQPHLGTIPAASVVGAVCMVLAFAGIWAIPETYGRDLDFVEE